MRPSIGPYHIIRELGRGAMGVVYLGYDSDIERPVAIKTIQVDADEPQAEALREALGRDARAAGRLSHPGIVTIFQMGREQDSVFVVMEYVDGPTLAEWARTAPHSPAEIVALLRKVADALDYAHSVPIVHRDIKPANILVARNGQPKITDFGLAKLATSASSRSGHLVGTPRYISPEQIRGAQVDGRSDQFSLAVMSYELLTGQVPFAAATYEALLYQILSLQPAPAHLVNPRLSPAVSQVLARALSKDPGQRYSTCLEFLSALEAAMTAQWVSTQTQLPPFAPPQSSRRQPYHALFIVVPVVIAIVVALSLWMSRLSKGDNDTGGITMPSETTQLTLADIPQAPFASQLPPVIEEARNPKVADPGQFAGPRHAQVAWKVRVQIPEARAGVHVVGAGPDGSVYLLSAAFGSSVLCSMRNQKLLWGYSNILGGHEQGIKNFDLAPDGLIWMVDGGSRDYAYCFNSRGQGGHMPTSVKPWIRQSQKLQLQNTISYDSRTRKITGSGYVCLPTANPGEYPNYPRHDRPGLQGRAWDGGDGWFLTLDQPCRHDAWPTIGPNGDVYFQTISKLLYRVSPQGQARFTYAAACMARQYYPLPSGDVLFFCGSDLYRVHDGNLLWKFSWSSEFDLKFTIDRTETVYAAAGRSASSPHDRVASRIVAVSPSGEKLWEVGFRELVVEDLFFDSSGSIYATGPIEGEGANGSGIVCLRD
jgi:serine/threonine protein kinase